MYNLELSQKRALEVMKFLYSLDINNKPLLEQYISASGRSYSDRIKNKRGYEQKNTSRRIEIKFRIKNEEAIRQLSNYLNK
jgi:chemotaxis protein MotB